MKVTRRPGTRRCAKTAPAAHRRWISGRLMTAFSTGFSSVAAAPPSEGAVVLSAVTKTFGAHTAVDDLSLIVPTGSCYGFIGPNDSGKTTTLRMIMRILEQNRGDVTVLGNTNTRRPDDRVGYLPEERGLYKQMKVRDVLKFYAAIKGADASRKSIDGWLDRLGLNGWGDKKVE